MDEPEDLSQLSYGDLQDRLQQVRQLKATEPAQPAAQAAPAERPEDLSKLSYPELQDRLQQVRATHRQILAPYREQAKDIDPDTGLRWGLKQFTGAVRSPLAQIGYGRARKALSEGTADESDYRQIALYEQEQQRNEQQSFGATVGGTALSLPGHAATLLAGGAAARGIGGVVGLTGKGLLPAAGRLGLQAAVTPDFAPSQLIQQNVQAGRDPFDVRGLPFAAAKSIAELATIGAVGGRVAKALPTSGLAGRVAVQGASGPFAQGAADAATYAMGLSTRYGTLQDLVEGKYGAAARGGALQIVNYGGLGFMHGEAEAGRKMMREAAEKIDANLGKGYSVSASVASAAAEAGAKVEKLHAEAAPEQPAEPPPAQPGESTTYSGAPRGQTPEGYDVIGVPKEQMGGAFGMAVTGEDGKKSILVRDDLPEAIDRFVREHERYHHNDPGFGSQSQLISELKANFFPGIKDPVGLIRTAIASLSTSRLSFYASRFGLKPAQPESPPDIPNPTTSPENPAPPATAQDAPQTAPDPETAPEAAGPAPGPTPETVETMRAALKSLGMKSGKWSAEEVMAEARRLKIAGAAERKGPAEAINQSVQGELSSEKGAGEEGPEASGGPAGRMTHEELVEAVREGGAIPGVTKAQMADLKARYLDDQTLEETGKKRGRTKEAARVSIDKALDKLHDLVEEPPPPSVQEKPEPDGPEGQPQLPDYGDLTNHLEAHKAVEAATDRLYAWIKGESDAGRTISASDSAAFNAAADRFNELDSGSSAKDRKIALRAADSFLASRAERGPREPASVHDQAGGGLPDGRAAGGAADQEPPAGPPAPARSRGSAAAAGPTEAAGDILNGPHLDAKGRPFGFDERVSALMKQGYNRKAAEDRASRELTPQTHTDESGRPYAMGAAALGELTGQAEGPADPRLTSLRHAQSELDRQALGLAAEAKKQGYPDDMVFDAARAAVQADPQLPDKLISELGRKNRPTDPIETAVLLRESTRLDNEIDRARMFAGDKERDPDGEYKADLEKLKDQKKRLLDATDPAGSAAGAAFRLRRALMDEDFTIVGLEKKAEEAKGSPLTEKEKGELGALHDKLRKAEDELEQLRGKTPDKPGQPLPEAVEVKKSKDEITNRIKRFEDDNKPWWARALDKALEVQRFNILSGGQTVEKLGGAAVARVVLAPVRQAVAAALGKLPFVRQVAEQSPRWGGLSPKAEVEAITTGLMTGLKAAKERSPLGEGRSAADIAYGDKTGRQSGVANRILAAPGEAHGALKAIPFENEMARSVQMRTEFYRKRGMNTDTDAMQSRIGKEAYQNAEEATFQRGAGDWVADQVNRIIGDLKKRGKDGNYKFLPYLAGTALKSQVPVLRVPLNIVGEGLRGIFGTITGSAGVADAIAKGVKELPPDRADLLMKRLTDGSIGAAFLTLGALGAAKVGGLYVQGDRRKKDIPEGKAEVFGVRLPKEALHDPRLQLMQAGATAVQQAQRYVKGQQQGTAAGVGAAFGAYLREVPFVREATTVDRALSPSTQGGVAAEFVKSMSLPQLVQWIAREMDKPHPFMPGEEPTQRTPHGFKQDIEVGVPGLRKNVPIKR